MTDRPIVTARYSQDMENARNLGGNIVRATCGVEIAVSFRLHHHEDALRALNVAVADIQAQIGEAT